MANENQLNGLLESSAAVNGDHDLQLSDEEVIMPPIPPRTASKHAATATVGASNPQAAAPTVSPHPTGKARQKARKKAQSRKNRQKDRQEMNARQFSHHTSRPSVEKKYKNADHAEDTPVTIADSKVARTAYVGLNSSTCDETAYTLGDLVGPGSKFGFRLVKYKAG